MLWYEVNSTASIFWAAIWARSLAVRLAYSARENEFCTFSPLRRRIRAGMLSIISGLRGLDSAAMMDKRPLRRCADCGTWYRICDKADGGFRLEVRRSRVRNPRDPMGCPLMVRSTRGSSRGLARGAVGR